MGSLNTISLKVYFQSSHLNEFFCVLKAKEIHFVLISEYIKTKQLLLFIPKRQDKKWQPKKTPLECFKSFYGTDDCDFIKNLSL